MLGGESGHCLAKMQREPVLSLAEECVIFISQTHLSMQDEVRKRVVSNSGWVLADAPLHQKPRGLSNPCRRPTMSQVHWPKPPFYEAALLSPLENMIMQDVVL